MSMISEYEYESEDILSVIDDPRVMKNLLDKIPGFDEAVIKKRKQRQIRQAEYEKECEEERKLREKRMNELRIIRYSVMRTVWVTATIMILVSVLVNIGGDHFVNYLPINTPIYNIATKPLIYVIHLCLMPWIIIALGMHISSFILVEC